MTASLYERLGGKAAIHAVVDLFYQRVLTDPRIKHFYAGVDIERLKAHQRAFLQSAYGAAHLTGWDMTSAHAALVQQGLNDLHVDAVIEHFSAALHQFGVNKELIAEAVAIAESMRAAVLGKHSE